MEAADVRRGFDYLWCLWAVPDSGRPVDFGYVAVWNDMRIEAAGVALQPGWWWRWASPWWCDRLHSRTADTSSFSM